MSAMLFRLLLVVCLLAPVASTQVADLVLTGARIYTVNPGQPTASAMAIRGERILAVGDNLQEHIGPSTKVMDMAGATVIPGLIDSHVHLAGLGQALEILDLREAASIDDVTRKVRAAAASAKPGEWIRGRGWDQTRWPGKEFPDRNYLTEAAPNNPVYLSRVDGHAAWVNAKALELGGVDASTPHPQGGRIVRNPEGDITGILIDRAMGLVSRQIPEATPQQLERRLQLAAEECVRLGLTSVHDAGVGRSTIEAYKALAARGALPIRSYVMIGGEGDLWREYLGKGPEIHPYVTVRAIKLVADGALGSRGAALIEAYADDSGNRGLVILQKEDVARVAKQAAEKGFQVATHAIGDLANRLALQAYGEALGGANDKRFRMEHAQIVHPDDFPLFKQHSIIASIQATHATSDMRWAEDRIGPQRALGSYAWRTFLDTGVRIANGSDFPVEHPNPMLGFHAAITRQDGKGWPKAGWYPNQRLTRDEALKSWTLDGAYAAFEEREKGSLEPGKLADFLVLSRNIMEVEPREILSTTVRMTFVGGKLVYQAAGETRAAR
ncbi:MAG: amidohydrolase [Bryobacterales bacterium]|nr:amidohydrolase [Bryobacterales bacterium]